MAGVAAGDANATAEAVDLTQMLERIDELGTAFDSVTKGDDDDHDGD